MKNTGLETAEICVTFVNDGVAPTYFDMTPYIYIEDEAGNLLERHLIPIDLKKLCQNCEEKSTINISRDILKKEGTRIYVGIEEPGNTKPTVYLTMEASREGAKSLLWSNKK